MPTLETPSAPVELRNRSTVDLTVVMPCYNEAEHIEETLRGWAEFLDGEVGPYEIIVVNDGSMDGSGRILDRVRKEIPALRVIHQLNGGKEAAIRRGYEAARGAYILQTETNGRFDPTDFPAFWENRTANGLILARRSRPLKGWLAQGHDRLLRHFVKLLFGAEWQEPQAPFRLVSRTCLQTQLARIPRGFAQVNLGMTLLAHTENPQAIREIAVPFRFRTGLKRNPSPWYLAGSLLHVTVDLIHLRLSLLRPRLPSQPAAEAG